MNVEVKHTKRSIAFQRRIQNLCDRLKQIVEGVGQLHEHEIEDIRFILEKFTTDSACIVNAAEDEPIFVLRGHDITAGGEDFTDDFHENGVVDYWCELQIAHRFSRPDLRDKPLDKIADARECASEMRAYPDRKWAD